MEDFLPMLRMRNIFRDNPASDRPFGMPNVDNQGFMDIMREVGPTAASMNRDDTMRGSNLISRNPGGRLSAAMQPQSNNLIRGKKNVVYGGTEGFSPTQQMFQREDREKRMQDFAREELNTKLANAVAMQDDKQAAEMEQIAREFGGRKELAASDQASQLALTRERAKAVAAENALQHTRDLERDKARITTTAANRPAPTRTAKDRNDEYLGRIQQLKIQDAALGKLLTQDPNDESWKVDPSANENQKRRIRQYLETGKFAGDTVPPVPGVDVPAGEYIKDDPSKRKPVASTTPPANDRVTVVDAKGKRGTIPRSQLAAAQKQGYKQVK